MTMKHVFKSYTQMQIAVLVDYK